MTAILASDPCEPEMKISALQISVNNLRDMVSPETELGRILIVPYLFQFLEMYYFKRSAKIYALLKDSRRTKTVVAHLEESARLADIDIQTTLHWIQSWLMDNSATPSATDVSTL